MRRLITLITAATALAATVPAAHAFEEPVTGTFTMTTAPGILPAWTSADITIAGITPGSVTTSRFATDAIIELPVVARAQTANATAGGFRISNTKTGASVRCLVPVIDTKARVIDCLTSAGYNSALFSIDSIASRESVTSPTSRTMGYQGLEIRLTPTGALTLNKELSSTVFSTSVRVGDGRLTVTRTR